MREQLQTAFKAVGVQRNDRVGELEPILWQESNPSTSQLMTLEDHSLAFPQGLGVKLRLSHRAKLSLRDTIPPCLGEDARGNDLCKQKD